MEGGDQPNQTQEETPGWQYRPGTSVAPTPVAAQPAPAPAPQPGAINVPAAPAAAAQPQPVPTRPVVEPMADRHDAGPMDMDAPYDPAASDPDAVEWTASEFISHDKGSNWYVMLGLGTVAATVGIYFITKDIVSVVAILALAIILGYLAGRKPRVLTNRLDGYGITVGQTTHPFEDYKSFAVIDEGAFWSVVFLPAKRFAVPLSLYLAPDDERRVIDVLGQYLPLEQGEMNSVDRAMRRLHF